MADFTLTVYDVSRAVSTAPNFTDNKTAAAVSNNYYVPNNGRVALVTNAVGTGTITVATPGTVLGLAITDLALVLADTKVRLFGTFPPDNFNDATGLMLVTVSDTVNILAFRM